MVIILDIVNIMRLMHQLITTIIHIKLILEYMNNLKRLTILNILLAMIMTYINMYQKKLLIESINL